MSVRENVAKTKGRPSRRAEILAAAETLIRTQGLGSVTTRAIAKEAGCSEGALYVHFKGRLELLLAMLQERLPEMIAGLAVLDDSAGTATPYRNLEGALASIAAFHERVTPLVCGLFAEPELMNAYRAGLMDRGKGPRGAIGRLERYVRAEQELGRVDRAIDAGAMATTLMGASFFRSFVEGFLGQSEPFESFSRRTLSLLLRQDG